MPAAAQRPRHAPRAATAALALAAALALSLPLARASSVADAAATAEVKPRYDEQGRLLLPADVRQWVFAGSSLGLSYSEGGEGMAMFHHTLIEPTAYRHFAATGELRDGTMLALLLHPTASGVLPGRQGQFAGALATVELAVKDTSRGGEPWAYYNFGGASGLRDRARALRAASCQQCHAEHAAYDHVFLQFYPLLAAAAPAGSPAARAAAGHGARTRTPAAAPATAPAALRAEQPAPAETAPRLALGGLDPLLLVAGEEEAGKEELVADHAGLRYRFLSEPNRAAFAADPARYAIANDTCPVAPGAAIDPAQFTVHAGRVYAFATAACIEEFRADPESFLAPTP